MIDKLMLFSYLESESQDRAPGESSPEMRNRISNSSFKSGRSRTAASVVSEGQEREGSGHKGARHLLRPVLLKKMTIFIGFCHVHLVGEL